MRGKKKKCTGEKDANQRTEMRRERKKTHEENSSRNKLKCIHLKSHTFETIQMMEDRRKHNNKGEKECEMCRTVDSSHLPMKKRSNRTRAPVRQRAGKRECTTNEMKRRRKKLSRASNVHTGRITKTVRLLEIKYMRCVNTKESMWKTYNKTVAVHTKCRMCLPCREIWIRCVFIFFRWYLLLGCVRLFSVCSLVRSFCVARFFHMLFYICRANWLLLVGCAATVTIVAFSAIRTRSSLLSLAWRILIFVFVCCCTIVIRSLWRFSILRFRALGFLGSFSLFCDSILLIHNTT